MNQIIESKLFDCILPAIMAIENSISAKIIFTVHIQVFKLHRPIGPNRPVSGVRYLHQVRLCCSVMPGFAGRYLPGEFGDFVAGEINRRPVVFGKAEVVNQQAWIKDGS